MLAKTELLYNHVDNSWFDQSLDGQIYHTIYKHK
jgi:hypothetical protein